MLEISDRMNVSHKEYNLHNVCMMKHNAEELNVYDYKTY
jgi:hypothetical protein